MPPVPIATGPPVPYLSSKKETCENKLCTFKIYHPTKLTLDFVSHYYLQLLEVNRSYSNILVKWLDMAIIKEEHINRQFVNICKIIYTKQYSSFECIPN